MATSPLLDVVLDSVCNVALAVNIGSSEDLQVGLRVYCASWKRDPSQIATNRDGHPNVTLEGQASSRS